MCKLCEGKLDYARIEEGWLYIESEINKVYDMTFPCSYCPWCGEKINNERMMPRIVTHHMKEEMREQEAESYDPSEDLC